MKRQIFRYHDLSDIFKIPTALFLFIGISVIFFDLQYWIMSKLPGTINEMCVMGAGLSVSNLLFSGMTSLLMGVLGAGLWLLFSARSFSIPAISSSGIGALLGMVTLFCPVCTFPLISIFGISIGLHFFTTFNTFFKAFSLLLITVGLYELNRQLKKDCSRCLS